MSKLEKEFYIRQDVVNISKELLGKYLITKIDNKITGGIISETEAYAGTIDKASHAYGNKRTKRTEVMYLEGGVAYVYLCYGIHSLFNIVTNVKDIPHAILIRGIKPIIGEEIMCKRRNKSIIDNSFCSGPGTLSQALGIKVNHSGIKLYDNEIWLEEGNYKMEKGAIKTGKRIGVDYAGEDALLSYRFWIDI